MEEQHQPPPSKSWSIHTRREITSKYEIQERVGSGAYSDVYKARRRSDSATVALKEIHDYQSAFREVEALQTLQNCPNVVVLHEYFWSEDEDAVLVLEYLPTDLAAVVQAAKKDWKDGICVGEVKRWMVQILRGVDACHRNSVVHRDLKPSNLLISDDGVLKIADFGQARILVAPGFVDELPSSNQPTLPPQPPEIVPTICGESTQVHAEEQNNEKGCMEPVDDHIIRDVDEDSLTYDGAASCLATCTTSDIEDPFQHPYSHETEEGRAAGSGGALTSCVGTRWFRAPSYYMVQQIMASRLICGPGCIFAELLSLEPIFLAIQISISWVELSAFWANLTEEIWPGCMQLPDYNIISFSKVEMPIGVEASLPNRSPDEVLLVKKLLCFDPARRATVMELLHDKYFSEEPLPVAISELRVPSGHGSRDEVSSVDWNDYKNLESDSDSEDFGSSHIATTENGFSIRFS